MVYNNYIYLTGGILFRKKLFIYKKNKNLKPTLSYIRKTLFDWLKFKLKKSFCLDCYSGTGVLGIEALSRGASYVKFIDNNFNTLNYLKKNLKYLNIKKNFEILNLNLLYFLRKENNKYDIIFIDPPFNKKILKETIYLLYSRNLISNNGYIYIESEINNTKINIPRNWILLKKKVFKKRKYELYIKI